MRKIDIDNWNRKEHFEYFSKYDNPFYGLVTEIDCTKALAKSKQDNQSFFSTYLHNSMRAINKTEAFKMRIIDDTVVLFDQIHSAATIGRSDGTFGFSFCEYSPDFDTFDHNMKQEIQAVEASSGLRVNENEMRSDVIHYSTIPWHKFTGLSHARNFNSRDSIPKITFGKASTNNKRTMLPISIEVHHGLVDGIHISQFLEVFQEIMNE